MCFKAALLVSDNYSEKLEILFLVSRKQTQSFAVDRF